MPSMDKDEAIVAVRKLFQKFEDHPTTVLQRELKHLSLTSIIQLHKFLTALAEDYGL